MNVDKYRLHEKTYAEIYGLIKSIEDTNAELMKVLTRLVNSAEVALNTENWAAINTLIELGRAWQEQFGVASNDAK